MANSRRRDAERAWGKTFPSDPVSPERAEKLVWEAHEHHGMSFREIARLTTIERQAIAAIYNRKRKFITRDTHDKIVGALDRGYVARAIDDSTRVPAAPYHLILKCLHAQGWREVDFIEMIKEQGWNHGFLRHNKRGREYILYGNARIIEWLRDTIGDKRGPSAISAKYMENRGFFPLIHYNEEGKLLVTSLRPDQRARLNAWKAKQRKNRPPRKHRRNEQ